MVKDKRKKKLEKIKAQCSTGNILLFDDLKPYYIFYFRTKQTSS